MIESSQRSAAVARQYARWPYPHVPLLASLPSTRPWQLHCDWLWDRCGSGPAPARPRLWIAGCGTFQPYVFGVANPHATIVATDRSEPSLAIAARRCRLHRVRNVTFAPCDLDDPGSWPAGEFDLIECYGVLMNLRDPGATLRALGERLAPRGVLRLMVYPHFSRARIVQLQRLATLCGFHAGDATHPRRFRAFVRSLPKDHPLRHAFTGYADARNDAGVVDAFLHAGDRTFTAFELGAMVDAAGLEPAFWFHRPWAQPDVAAAHLGMTDRGHDVVLGYLDLWHELRQNFVVCLRRAAAPRERAPERVHPSFRRGGGTLRHELRLLRLRVCGGRVPTRTGDGDVVLRAADARALDGDPAALPRQVRERLRRDGLLLGGDAAPPSTMPVREGFAREREFLRHAGALRVGRLAPNPLYGHLFAAFELDRLHPELGLPDLETQLGRWCTWADPLEDRAVRFGLTPYGTLQHWRRNVLDHLARAPLPEVPHFAAVRLRDDAARLAAVHGLLRDRDVPRRAFDDASLRELWLLCCGHRELFTTLFEA